MTSLLRREEEEEDRASRTGPGREDGMGMGSHWPFIAMDGMDAYLGREISSRRRGGWRGLDWRGAASTGADKLRPLGRPLATGGFQRSPHLAHSAATVLSRRPYAGAVVHLCTTRVRGWGTVWVGTSDRCQVAEGYLWLAARAHTRARTPHHQRSVTKSPTGPHVHAFQGVKLQLQRGPAHQQGSTASNRIIPVVLDRPLQWFGVGRTQNPILDHKFPPKNVR